MINNWQITREKIILGQSVIILLMIIVLAGFVVTNNRTIMECGKAQVVSYPCPDIKYPQCPDCLCNINSLYINTSALPKTNSTGGENG